MRLRAGVARRVGGRLGWQVPGGAQAAGCARNARDVLDAGRVSGRVLRCREALRRDGPQAGGRGWGRGRARGRGHQVGAAHLGWAAIAVGDLADEPGGQAGLDGQGDARGAAGGGVDGQPPAGVGPGRGEVAEPQRHEVPVGGAEAGAHRRGRGVDQDVDAAVLLLGRPGRLGLVGQHAVDQVRWDGDHELAVRDEAEVALLVSSPDSILQSALKFRRGSPCVGHGRHPLFSPATSCHPRPAGAGWAVPAGSRATAYATWANRNKEPNRRAGRSTSQVSGLPARRVRR